LYFTALLSMKMNAVHRFCYINKYVAFSFSGFPEQEVDTAGQIRLPF
jgi:hypothetical protein